MDEGSKHLENKDAMSNNNYQDFEERILDQIRDMEDAEGNSERRSVRWALKVGAIYGLTKDEIMALRRPGMKHVEWMRAIDAARKGRQ